MKRYVFCAAIIALAACTAAPTRTPDNQPTPRNAEPVQYEGYELVWHDEFDIDGRPSDEWSYEHGFVRNEELQWYQPDNASVENGCLVITGRRETVPNPRYNPEGSDWREVRPVAEYTSACVTTRNSFTFRYGRMEVRARIPVASGSWPAIWTLGNRWPWPANGEIDIMEFYRRGEPIILANACWLGDDNRDAWDESTTPYTHFLGLDADWADKFHVWRMDWDAEFIRLYLDGELLNEVDLTQSQRGGGADHDVNPFSNDIDGFGHYILLNLALGSNGGEPDIEAFPMRYEVDYVRVYQPVKQ